MQEEYRLVESWLSMPTENIYLKGAFMTSEKQILANRANCLKSTGPRTEEGKHIASRNSITHGLLADDILIRGEDTAKYESFHDHLWTDLNPHGQLETLLTERIIGFFWRLRRAGRMEQDLLNLLGESPAKTDKQGDLPFNVVIRKAYAQPADDPEYQEFLKYKQQDGSFPGSVVSDQSQRPVESECPREDSKASLGDIVRSDFTGSGLLERLLRYEGQLERSLYRALDELRVLQCTRRRNEAISIPVETQDCCPPAL